MSTGNSRTNWLLLRGLTRDQRHWEGFDATFAERLGAPVAVMDPPGFGTENQRTSPTSVAAITDDIRERFERGDGDWSILAISLGGMIALDWCARYPDDFQRCVVINSSTAASPVHHRTNPTAVPGLVAGRLRSVAGLERAVLARSSNSPAAVRGPVAERWARYAQQRPPKAASIGNQILAVRRFGMPEPFATPLLVLASRADRLVSHRASELIAERLGAPIRLHDSGGHDLPLDDGPWICDQVLDWVDGSG